MKTLFLSLVALLAGAAAAEAQSCQNCRSGYVAGCYCAGMPHHASTAAESYLRGLADLGRARATYNLMTSQAMVNLAQAQRLEMENQVVKTGVFHKKRELNQEYQAKQRRQRSAAYSQVHHTPANRPAPGRLTPTHSPADRIAWPAALRGTQFTGYRAVVEQICTPQTNLGSVAPKDRSKLTQTCRAMEIKLDRQARNVSSSEFALAKQFLEQLVRACDS